MLDHTRYSGMNPTVPNQVRLDGHWSSMTDAILRCQERDSPSSKVRRSVVLGAIGIELTHCIWTQRTRGIKLWILHLTSSMMAETLGKGERWRSEKRVAIGLWSTHPSCHNLILQPLPTFHLLPPWRIRERSLIHFQMRELAFVVLKCQWTEC